MVAVRFNPQPAHAIIYEKRWSVPALARAAGVSPGHLYAVLKGLAAPSDALRTKLPEILEVPLAQLFTPEQLAKVWRGPGENHYTKVAAAGGTNA